MKEPLVSVIIPAYNASQTIVACLDSVCGQTYKNLEVIVVDDGSADETFAIVQHYAERHKNIPIKIYSIANSGPASARNYGIKHSAGEYIAFLDSDDRWAPIKIERQITCLRVHPDIDLLGCKYSIGERKSLDFSAIKYISKIELLLKNYFSTPCVIVKRFVLGNLKFEEGRKYSEDYFLWLQIICHNYQCAVLLETLTYLCDKPIYGSSGLSAKLWQMEKGELKNYKQLLIQKNITIGEYVLCSSYSLCKYVIRLIRSSLRILV